MKDAFALLSKVSFWTGIGILAFWIGLTIIEGVTEGGEGAGISFVFGGFFAVPTAIIAILIAWLLEKGATKVVPSTSSSDMSPAFKIFITAVLVILCLFGLLYSFHRWDCSVHANDAPTLDQYGSYRSYCDN